MEFGKSKKGERGRLAERYRVPSIRLRQHVKRQAKGGDIKKNAYTPPENGEL